MLALSNGIFNMKLFLHPRPPESIGTGDAALFSSLIIMIFISSGLSPLQVGCFGRGKLGSDPVPLLFLGSSVAPACYACSTMFLDTVLLSSSRQRFPSPHAAAGSDALLKTTEVIRSCSRHAGRTLVAPNCPGFEVKHCKDCLAVPKAPCIPVNPGVSA